MSQDLKKIDIRSLSLDTLKTHLVSLGEPGFRAKQIYDWLWVKATLHFDQMSNLSKALREKLKEIFVINAISVHQSQFSADKTIKSIFKLKIEKVNSLTFTPKIYYYVILLTSYSKFLK